MDPGQLAAATAVFLSSPEPQESLDAADALNAAIVKLGAYVSVDLVDAFRAGVEAAEAERPELEIVVYRLTDMAPDGIPEFSYHVDVAGIDVNADEHEWHKKPGEALFKFLICQEPGCVFSITWE